MLVQPHHYDAACHCALCDVRRYLFELGHIVERYHQEHRWPEGVESELDEHFAAIGTIFEQALVTHRKEQ